MEIIGEVGDVEKIGGLLGGFVDKVSPWLKEECSMEEVGYIYILDDTDIGRTTVPIHPQVVANVRFDLEEYEDWEFVEVDSKSGYWNAVAILGNSYGLSIFFSKKYLESLPKLKRSLLALLEDGGCHVE